MNGAIIPVDLPEREWVKLKDFAANDTYTVEDMTKYKEVMVMFSHVYPRQTVLIAPMSLFQSTHLFPDSMYATTRIYCDIAYASATSITVTSVTGLSTGMAFSLYAR